MWATAQTAPIHNDRIDGMRKSTVSTEQQQQMAYILLYTLSLSPAAQWDSPMQSTLPRW